MSFAASVPWKPHERSRKPTPVSAGISARFTSCQATMDFSKHEIARPRSVSWSCCPGVCGSPVLRALFARSEP